MVVKILTVLAMLLVLLKLVEPSLAATYNISGDWHWTDTVSRNGAAYYGTARIVQDGNTLSFTWDWVDQYIDVWTGTGQITDSTFTIDAYVPDRPYTATFQGIISQDGNLLTGDWQQVYQGLPDAVGTFTATRLATPSPSPTPSPTPTPIPTPTPFLDLPWDYEGKGLTFSEAALSMSSYFDHEYPLLSASLIEPPIAQNNLTNFEGRFRTNLEYSTHDGYDYAKKAKALLNNPVLAAADGVATLGDKNKCSPCGNYILIDHGNAYQTRYYHLSGDSLIVGPGQSINVLKGQQIGKIGATGNVIPPGDAGAHIHFMVVEDKNKDGNFEDNIPDGLVDPFGWQSEELDPWENYSFDYGGQARTGNRSYYLWAKAIANLSPTLTTNGGFFELEKYKLDFPQNATGQNLNLELKAAPNAKPSNILQSIGSTLSAVAKDLAGNIVRNFQEFFTLTIGFSEEDLDGFDQSTLSIYSSEDGINWTKEDTRINWTEKTASASVNHFSYFALMAERLDTTAPTTTAILVGTQGQSGWFRSKVEVILEHRDNEGGLGVDYTLYKVNDENWQQYLEPLNFEDEGHYTIEYYSVDKDENIEQVKSTEFEIDKTLPIAQIQTDPSTVWPPNGKMVDVVITGSASDNNGTVILEVEDEYNEIEPTLSYFGEIIKLQASRRDDDKDGRIYRIKILDLAGNIAESIGQIIVPHDQR